MATTALSAITPIAITDLDDAALKALKTKYNALVKVGQDSLDVENSESINAKVNAIQDQITNFNTTLTQINEIAAAINKLDPQAQVSGEATLSTISLSLTGSVILS